MPLPSLLRVLLLLSCLLHSPPGQAEQSLSGKLVIVGSDTLSELMALWSAGFSQQFPGVSIELQAGGSAAAPPALIRGTANVGSMSRRMTAAEKQRFVQERGFEPLEIPLATDTITVIVHRDNPLEFLTSEMIAAVFSLSVCGAPGRFTTWGDVGLEGDWGKRRIEVFGRTLASGTYEFFRNRALCGADPGVWVGEFAGSAALLNTVATTPGAIGYIGAGFVDERVRVPPLLLPTGQLIHRQQMPYSTAYPFNRTLYLYLPLSNGEKLPVMECEFLRYIRSAMGETLLLQAGFLPLANVRDIDSNDLECVL
jgi:phosphate transport system substrate-binding protein